jgi:tryptophan synthase alpha chain
MTVSRIDARFAALQAEGRAGFVTYVMAGDPSAQATLEILRGLPGAGADLIELGFPFSDPMAEGPTIQRAAARGLKSGMTVRGTLELVRGFREGDADTPVILMGYLNPLETWGHAAFARDAAAAGVDGLIVVDCPPEEAGPLTDALDAEGLALIRLATPTTDDARLKIVTARTSGFVYYVSVAGVTGARTDLPAGLIERVQWLRTKTDVPILVGFGISSPEQVKAVAEVADGVIVGSALVRRMTEAADQPREAMLADVSRAVADLAAACG